MSVDSIKKLEFTKYFTLEHIALDYACTFTKDSQLDTYTIFWIQDGHGSYQIDFKTHQFDSNTLVFLSPGQILQLEKEKIKSAYMLSFQQDFYCIQTHDKEVSCNGLLFNASENTVAIRIDSPSSQYLQGILDQIAQEMQIEALGQYDLLQTYLKQFMIYSVRLLQIDAQVETQHTSRLYKDFNVLLSMYFKNAHQVSFYAERLGIASKSLAKHFQKIGIASPSQLLKDRLILEAKRLLAYSDYSVKEIALDLGFEDPAYFSRFYKKATQNTPLHFRSNFKH